MTMAQSLKNNVFILDAQRTAVGSPFKSLKTFTPAELAGSVIKSLLRRTKVQKKSIEEVYVGNVVSAGQGQNIARQAALAGGVPKSVPALTINNVCGAGLQTVVLGAQSILSGTSGLIICGGTESATHNPYFIEGDVDQAFNPRDIQDSLIKDGLTCPATKKHMGVLVEGLARKHRISRKDQDYFALNSHVKAVKAQDDKVFHNEIVSLKLSAKKTFRKDERPRRRLSIENFETLRPAFHRSGTVTAGNASAPADGAAALLLANRDYVKSNGLKPLARVRGMATVATDPVQAFESCPQAVRLALSRSGLKMSDIDVFEVAESFAAQALWTQRKLRIPAQKFNIYGGDLAFGHPLGAAGMRALVTLITALHQTKRAIGVVTIAYGGGGATALIVERMGKA